ncbi:hypothetical protein Slin_2181 [Spirosoma linguale DSM 74]|uniref:Cyclophilin-like domain-containing protein n=2 Tax=Spirosoma TaxID=107 RepID=D2QDS5_SPILD|nr:hypothetical protein Slin_2181 [Spirosoma linguale DSM 74]
MKLPGDLTARLGNFILANAMKQTQMLLLPLLLGFLSTLACTTDDPMNLENPIPPAGNTAATNPGNPNRSNRLRIRIGTDTFTATLLDNPSVEAFKARLPLTIVMKELNGNEKFVDLPTSLPTSASNPGAIQAGDLMLYGSSTLVLFYETFQTSYRYTKLGRIENSTGLAAALGTAKITVTFELE